MEKGTFFALKSKSQDNSFRATPLFTGNSSEEGQLVDKLAEGKFDCFEFPIKFVQDRGERLYDFLNTSWVGLYLISNRIREILLENEISGWSSYNIELYDKKGEIVPGYWGFAVHGRVGKIAYSEDTIIGKRLIPDGPLCSFYVGKFFNLNSWDSSEIFLSANSRAIFCTSKVVNLLIASKCTHVYFEDITTIQVAKSNVEFYNKNLSA
ncbi:imm11 family protein [Phnomibacter sp. MR]|uniref:imm11 family protein n=1 Tax=Phnomibacter sp. MR TaxID=3042318 RepID=UPI003A7FFE2A